MTITYQEKDYFKIQSKENLILIDPTNQRSFKNANIVMFTKQSEEDIVSDLGSNKKPITIYHQGEYEINKINIQGWGTEHIENIEKTMYRINIDDVSIGILGLITKDIDPKILFELKNMDILITPAGGDPYISKLSLAKLIRQIEPKIIIPSIPQKSDELIKELGNENIETLDKLSIKKKDIIPDITKIVILRQTLSN